MRPYVFERPGTVEDAVRRSGDGTAFLAGGTTLVDLMKLEVMTPGRVLDLNRLPLHGIEAAGDGLRIGALERMSEVAADPRVRRGYPMLSQALESSASGQLRNMASIGGNLLQRTRCGYFREVSTPCNKRQPGSGCLAINGENRMHAVLGTSDSCVATHPSDLAVALVALDAKVRLRGRDGGRTVELRDFYPLPGDTPHREHDLRPGELLTEVLVPRLDWARHSLYLKVRDRQSYEFALSSAAVAVRTAGNTIVESRVAVGGMGTRPWRLPAVERALAGRPATEASYTAAAATAVDGARPLRHNAFKPALMKRTIVRALLELERTR
ncbi:MULTISPECIES: xanthine dehydrogenase family protein subunit M [unclassified Crossiella]|uniref:FAD binding domain-containing protein n=1 Tax=unclassified Crossiella TaxID=2620835 RepID=UPI001FFE781B|nr:MULTISPECIES: xanthine dehydrogenase family protein subunit M [unclassified Crossiella]MCK2238952.1 xanthine dehydrogenase family protein subunit M [Crossiella sp. S99.2]MCK2251478.1 xanthine dehydrogenase family protein subunit M [Crossiella sp. S99.1]